MNNRSEIKGNSLSSTLEWADSGDLGRLSDLPDPNDIQVKATVTGFGCVRSGGGGGRCMMGRIRLKPH